MSEPKSKIIIKKVKKVSGEGGHGGSWKVAYADFVTAMMAFFLLLWLISMVSPEKKAAVSMYFKNFNLFDKSGKSVMTQASSVLEHVGETQATLQAKLKGQGEPATKADVENAIKQAVQVKLGDIKDQIIVDVLEGGVRIQLVDKAGKPMFDLGSAEPTPLATRILQVIGEQIKNLPNPVSVEGYTDAIAFRSSTHDNWELSTERALSAKKQLETYGMDANRLTRVAGYADTVPFIKEDPEDPRNRRISIILLFPQQSSDTSSQIPVTAK